MILVRHESSFLSWVIKLISREVINEKDLWPMCPSIPCTQIQPAEQNIQYVHGQIRFSFIFVNSEPGYAFQRLQFQFTRLLCVSGDKRGIPLQVTLCRVPKARTNRGRG